MQYIHDIEQGRRNPSPPVAIELANALHMNPNELLAGCGRTPAEVIEYLREHPASAAAVAGFFAKAHAANFTAWDRVNVEPKQQALAARSRPP